LPAWARRRSPAALLLAAALGPVYGVIEALNYGRGASIGMQGLRGPESLQHPFAHYEDPHGYQ